MYKLQKEVKRITLKKKKKKKIYAQKDNNTIYSEMKLLIVKLQMWNQSNKELVNIANN